MSKIADVSYKAKRSVPYGAVYFELKESNYKLTYYY
jgi:hypothetical protein